MVCASDFRRLSRWLVQRPSSHSSRKEAKSVTYLAGLKCHPCCRSRREVPSRAIQRALRPLREQLHTTDIQKGLTNHRVARLPARCSALRATYPPLGQGEGIIRGRYSAWMSCLQDRLYFVIGDLMEVAVELAHCVEIIGSFKADDFIGFST